MGGRLGGTWVSRVTDDDVLDDDNPTPLYVQLAELLRRRIARGELGARVPSLKSLAQDYEVSHITAEKAVGLLRDEGLVVTVVGRGTFVKRRDQE